MENGDKLERLLFLQGEFEKQFYDFSSMSLEEKEALTKEFVLHLNVEAIEVLNEVNYKPWKKTHKIVDVKKVKEELVDVLHFYLILCQIWGLDADSIMKEYEAKHKVNYIRQETGY